MKNHLEVALSQWGTKSITGPRHNQTIVSYFKEIKASWVKNDDTAWCAAFVNWVLMKSGYAFNSKLNARSFLEYGTPTKTPTTGDIVVFWRIAPNTVYGHVGFFIKEENDMIYCLGGNQSETVNVTAFSKKNLLGYRKLPVQS